jgi:hypothetical protein
VASLNVTVAAYGTLEAAAADWDDPGPAFNVIDAVLIERSAHRVVMVHRYPSSGWAQGTVGSALVGRLSPASLLDGAIAGGVGKHVLTFISDGLSRDAVNELGLVLESGRFVTLSVLERVAGRIAFGYSVRALSLASLPLRGTVHDLKVATDADAADDDDDDTSAP